MFECEMWNGHADLLNLAVLGIDVRVQDADLSYCPVDVRHNPLGIRSCLAIDKQTKCVKQNMNNKSNLSVHVVHSLNNLVI